MTKDLEDSFSKLGKGALGLGGIIVGLGTLLKGVSKLGYIQDGFEEMKKISNEMIPKKAIEEVEESPEEECAE